MCVGVERFGGRVVTLYAGGGFSGELGQDSTRRWDFDHELVGEVRIFLQAYQFEGQIGLEREPANSLGDVGDSAFSEYCDDEIFQGGHGTGCISGSYL